MELGDGKRIRTLICLALALATVSVYWRVGGFDFISLDDPQYVTRNPMVTGGLTFDGVFRAFTQSHASNWHPLTWISHMIDCQIFGLHAGGPHLVNLAFHLANTVLLFLLIYRLTGAQWRSAVVAGLFALHPLHVESVAWISERKDVLSTFFGLVALLFYERGTRSGKPRLLHLALIFFVLGLLAKPMLVTLPFILLLLDFWPLQRVENTGLRTFVTREFWKLVLEKWPWFALAAASSVATFYAQKSAGAVAGTASFPIFWRMVNGIEAYFGYLQKTFWPADLAVFYPLETYRPVLPFVVAIAVLLVVSVLALASIRRCPALLVGWLWFLGTLVPVIGLVQVGAQSMADRYTYVPLIGFFIGAVWLAHSLLNRSKPGLILGRIAATIVLALCVARSVSQVRYWQDSIALFSHTVAVTHNNGTALNCLGIGLEDAGRYQEALLAYQTAVRIRPDLSGFHKNVGLLLTRMGRDDEALAHYADAVRLDPQNGELQDLYAAALAAAGRNDDALLHYEEAVRVQPANAVLQNHLGAALARRGMMDAAIDRYHEAIRLRPDYAEAYSNLGAALTTRNLPEDAIANLTRALAIDPQSAEAHNNLGRALVLQGKLTEAIAEYREALRLNPNHPVFHFNLGLAFSRIGRRSDAIDQFQDAVRLDPKSPEAHYQLGRCLTDSGSAEPAMTHLREAARLRPDWAEPLNALAWILAMDDRAEIRDGAEAVRLAEKSAALTEWQQPGILNTLAAAYAEAGRFDAATNAATQAILVARKSGRTNLIAQFQFALERYQRGQTLRQN